MAKNSHIAIMLIQARMKLGYRQKDLAVKLGITSSGLCRYERGSRVPSMKVINKLKVLLGGSAQDLLVNLLG